MFGGKGRATRLYFAADLHGSQPTFRKFLNAASFYDVDALVFGGDLMGKALVPIVKTNGSYQAHFNGQDHSFEADGLAAFTKSIEVPGFYWQVLDPDEYAEARSDPLVRKAMFQELARERLGEWISLAEDRLAGGGVRLFITGGNDDEPAVLETLAAHDGTSVVPCEGTLVELDDEHTMVTVGLSTPTPWDTPREASEAEIEAAIRAEVDKVPDVGRAVFNFHCPPKDTPIDTCLKLERPVSPGEMPRPVREGGRFVTTGGGSSAVSDAIRLYQPVAGLHGHIHESAGRVRFGRTPCFNPGSEYVQGSLQGWIVSLRGGKVSAYQHTSG
jgi:uncharacterized protein